MPLYQFDCKKCLATIDKLLSISKRNEKVVCHECGEQMTRIISCKIERVEPVWLNEMSAMLPDENQKRVSDRTSFNKELDRSGLMAV
jgi:putative FmdB family regulatory protein